MARSFPGGNTDTDKVTIAPYTAINNLSTLTVALWTYRTGDGGNATGNMISRALDSINLYTSSGGKYFFSARRWTTNDGEWSITRPALSQWHHVAWTYSYSSTTNDAVGYLDGVSVNVNEEAAPTGTATTDDSGTNLVIGNRIDARCWDGRLDHIAIWDRILSADEVRYLHALKATAPQDDDSLVSGLVFYMPLGIDSPEPNEVAGGNTGTVTNTSTVAGPSLFTPDTGGGGAFPGLGGLIVR